VSADRERSGPEGHRLALAAVADWFFGCLMGVGGLVIVADSGSDRSLAIIGLIVALIGVLGIAVAGVRLIQSRRAARAFQLQTADAMADVVDGA
jgi:hypothetical protein